MGEERVKTMGGTEMQNFMRNLLTDVRALEFMLNNDWFETGIKRIGAEQEMCLIDRYAKPALVNMAMMENLSPPWLTTELGQFNLECNMTPHEFEGAAFELMEKELVGYLKEINKEAAKHKVDVFLTGILPTLKKSDLRWENLTPKPRYKALMQALMDLRGSDYEVRLDGIDELILKHDSPLLEACNTSFQVHLQVDPKDFVKYYNIALALAGPVVAAAANSPLLFGKRLWHETRIVLFQQSVDNRTSSDHLRDRQPRVNFGNDWLRKSILEIYREDISRFRPILAALVEEDPFELIKQGITPKLHALQVHNSTVYRWNRPCYGISDNGKPHLRIENRVLPAGPTVLDEMANTAFWLGLMEGVAKQYGDITKHMSFDDARDNFYKGARTGIDSKFTWLNDSKIAAKDLLINELIPLSRDGLQSNGINEADIDKYLSIIEGRATNHATGARWMLRTYSQFIKETTKDEALTAMTKVMLENQQKGTPIHEWEIPKLEDLHVYEPSKLTVEDLMQTDLVTVHENDVLELVADMMDWRKIRYAIVEDEKGKLVGLITSRLLLRQFSRPEVKSGKKSLLVKEVMVRDMLTLSPESPLSEAINLMDQHEIGCIPIVKGDRELVGILTEKDFIYMAKRLINRKVQE